jgi:general secretion pathway protein G
MVVMIVIGVLASFGVPKFVHSLEQSRVDMAATNLRAIWTAQRLYWLAHQTYAPDLNSLYSDPTDGENFLAEPEPVDPSQPSYVCALTTGSTSATDFQATATRTPSTSWSGSLSIGANGVVSGSITGPDGFTYYPTANFQ